MHLDHQLLSPLQGASPPNLQWGPSVATIAKQVATDGSTTTACYLGAAAARACQRCPGNCRLGGSSSEIPAPYADARWGAPAVSEGDFMGLPDRGVGSRLVDHAGEIASTPTAHVETRLPNGLPARLIRAGPVSGIW